MKKRILIVDDEPSICITLAMALGKKYATEYKLNGKDALSALNAKDFDLVILDLKIGEDDGLEILRKIKAEHSSVSVIMMTAFGSIDSTVEAMRAGAYTYVTKPFRTEEMLLHVDQALHLVELEQRITHLNSEIQNQYNYYGIIGNSPGMKRVFSLIEKVKDSMVSVLITGESGSGKELVARAIHYTGARKNANFVAINCAAIPVNLLEDEMFGHVKGSYTGASSYRRGRLEQADSGTLFLDEIGDMPLEMQAKLLRVLETKRFSPIGGEEEIAVDVRVVAATNKDLPKMVTEGLFREDLFYRLNVIDIHIPPLRERAEDITSLCDFFLDKFSKNQGKRKPTISHEAKKAIFAYPFPGNVRQLANILEFAMIVNDSGELGLEDLPDELRQRNLNASKEQPASDIECTFFSELTLREIERRVILSRLDKFHGHQQQTAASLGISERSIRNKLNEYRNDGE